MKVTNRMIARISSDTATNKCLEIASNVLNKKFDELVGDENPGLVLREVHDEMMESMKKEIIKKD